jgi:hypothetical protein
MYGNEWEGRGLAKSETNIYYFLGQALHDGLAAIAAGVDIEELANAARIQVTSGLLPGDDEYCSPAETAYAHEQAALVEGLLRGFHKVVWPRILEQYDVVHVEKALVYRHNEQGKPDPNGRFVFMSKPDLIVRSKLDGTLWYLEYKSTSSQREEWVNSWESAVQLHSGVRAIEQTLGEPATGVIVQGLYKGYASSGKQNSPFCYGYFKPGDPPFTRDRWSYTYVQGMKKYPIWEKPGGVKAWVESMPEALLAEQFPQVPPIFINESLVDAFFYQRAIREQQISNASLLIQGDSEVFRDIRLADAFPQRFDKCQPSFGSPCQFKRLCFGPHPLNPEAEGYILRDNSHRKPFEELIASEMQS